VLSFKTFETIDLGEDAATTATAPTTIGSQSVIYYTQRAATLSAAVVTTESAAELSELDESAQSIPLSANASATTGKRKRVLVSTP